ncbi:MAG: hypothetical protein AB1631_19785 [Acidobacteriota bacterium]
MNTFQQKRQLEAYLSDLVMKGSWIASLSQKASEIEAPPRELIQEIAGNARDLHDALKYRSPQYAERVRAELAEIADSHIAPLRDRPGNGSRDHALNALEKLVELHQRIVHSNPFEITNEDAPSASPIDTLNALYRALRSCAIISGVSATTGKVEEAIVIETPLAEALNQARAVLAKEGRLN